MGGLHQAARIGQTRPWQWPLAWLTRPREALIHWGLNGGHGKQLPATSQMLFLILGLHRVAGDNRRYYFIFHHIQSIQMALLGKMYILDIIQGICSGTSSDATFKNFAESSILFKRPYELQVTPELFINSRSLDPNPALQDAYSRPYINNIIAYKNSLINIFCLENIFNRHDGRKEAFFYVFMLDKSHQE